MGFDHNIFSLQLRHNNLHNLHHHYNYHNHQYLNNHHHYDQRDDNNCAGSLHRRFR
jgi:hypothetical protein